LDCGLQVDFFCPFNYKDATVANGVSGFRLQISDNLSMHDA